MAYIGCVPARIGGSMFKFFKLSLSYLAAYSTDSQQNKHLKKRLVLMHSWVKLHQSQVNNANVLKYKTQDELDKLREKHKLMSTAHGNEQRMRIYYVNLVTELQRKLKEKEDQC
jgi:hypothetical protein